ncbi:hypothetical protein E5K42_02985 [Helicobacter pylori]|nr:hypothetical protein E5K42_02985 [Helicobacter pylori]
MKQSLLKKIGLVIGGFGALMALGLLANKGSNNNNKEEIYSIEEIDILPIAKARGF